jgi:hypothetical protein
MAALTIDPWREKGIPLDRQVRSWKRRVKEPYDKRDVDAYTRARVILMNGVEAEAWSQSHAFARATDDPDLRTLLAATRMIEQQQQTTINWLNPADQSILETTVAYEQVAIDLTAYLARNEPDPYLRETFNFGLLEDFDHLYRYSELLDYLEAIDPNTILQGRTEVLPGRPTIDHHNDPIHRLRRHYEKNRALPASKIHVLTLLSAEQQTYAFYKTAGPMYPYRLARELYAEIGEVEEEHVTQYESLMDPAESRLERQLLHELTEVYNYMHCYAQEPDPRIRQIWEEFLRMELTHAQLFADALRRHEGLEPETLFGRTLTVDFRFEENKGYVRAVLERQRDLRLLGRGFSRKDDLPGDWSSYRYKADVNRDGVPSEEIVRIQSDRHQPIERPGDELLERARRAARNTPTDAPGGFRRRA